MVILTPEAIAEVILEYIRLKKLHSVPVQALELSKNSLVHIVLKDEEADIANAEEIKRKHWTTHANYSIAIRVTTEEMKELIAKVEVNNVNVSYSQIFGEEVEALAREAMMDWLRRWNLENYAFDIRYESDKSKKWKYHDKTEGDSMHMHFLSEKPADIGTLYVDSCLIKNGMIVFRNELLMGNILTGASKK